MARPDGLFARGPRRNPSLALGTKRADAICPTRGDWMRLKLSACARVVEPPDHNRVVATSSRRTVGASPN